MLSCQGNRQPTVTFLKSDLVSLTCVGVIACKVYQLSKSEATPCMSDWALDGGKTDSKEDEYRHYPKIFEVMKDSR